MATRKHRKTRGGKRNKKQKVIFMKGCSRHRHSKNCHCKHSHCRHCSMGGTKKCLMGGTKKCLMGGTNDPIAPLKMSGGAGLPPVPAPLVGKPWTPQVSGWHGVDGVDGGRNYLANNLYDKFDPQTMMKLDSTQYGGSRRSRRRRQYGGSLIPQQLTNLGRDLTFNFKSAYNSMNGYAAPVDPKPYMDQFRSTHRII